MAAVATIQLELKNLGSSSKRHNNELSQSSNKSLSILEAANQSFSDDQLAVHSLRKYEDFVTPFILACSEASAKSCASALQCIQTLAMFKGIAPSRLQELIQALKEATQLGLGIQLKILQVLPVLLFEFSADLSGTLVVDLLQVCAELLGGTKVAMVHNAAYATLQQLITGVFDRTDIEPNDKNTSTAMVQVNDEVQYEVPQRLHDSMMVLLDLCDIAEKVPPKFLKIKDLSLTFTLELLELTLSNQAQLIHKHKELASILRLRVTTLLLRLFSETAEFPVVLRVVRVFYLLLRQHLGSLTTESEVIMSTLCQGAVHNFSWKRVLCLEVFQGLSMEENLLFQIYSKFDAEYGRTKIIGNIVSQFATILSESNDLMLETDMTKSQYEQSLAKQQQNNGSGDSIKSGSGGDLSNSTANGATEFLIIGKADTTVTPLIEMLDRVEPPRIKLAHYYYLVIKCVAFITDDVHKFVSTEKEIAPNILVSLSTPLLKCHSASLSVAMDMDLFRQVVRAVQRLAHAAGIIGRRDLRDEFIQLLAQHCYIPEDVESKPWILGRCALCVRALFNLGYALGNQLEKSWSMITSVIFRLSSKIASAENSDNELNPNGFFADSHADYKNLNSSLKKLLESTTHLNDEALIHFMVALDNTDQLIKFRLLQFIVITNSLRFGNAKSECWHKFSELLLKGVMDSSKSFKSSMILNNTALTVLEIFISHSEDEESADGSLGMILLSVCSEINSQDNEIKVNAYQYLNMLLDKFGAKMSSGWDSVFGFISNIPATSDLELMQCAFKTLELVCSDFLENLPYPCVFKLTLCLDDFARQTVDLNTSFTSTSLFWSVCDHIMAGDNIGTDIDASQVHTESNLVAVAQDYQSASKRFALWLFAVLKLAEISGNVGQQQVRTSAIQIFLRLFDTHGPLLPIGVWDVVHSLVFPTLLQSHERRLSDSIAEIQESRILIIDGLNKIQTMFFNKYGNVTSFHNFWLQWSSFLQNSAEISPKLSIAVYKNLRFRLEADTQKLLPRESYATFWTKQNLRPEFASLHAKATADSLVEFVELYPYIKNEVDVLVALRLLTECAVFPYYTYPNKISSEMECSTLQAKSITVFDTIDISDNVRAQSEAMLLLNRMALSPFDGEAVSESSNFSFLSSWAQDKLHTIIENLSFPLCSEILSKFSSILVGMNKIIRLKGKRSVAIENVLRVLQISSSLQDYAPEDIIEFFQLLLSGCNINNSEGPGASIPETISSIEKFIQIIKTKHFEDGNWTEILKTLLQYSVLYERGLHNQSYYDSMQFDRESVFRFGTVEPVKQLHDTEISFFCLEMLRKLAGEQGAFAKTAHLYFLARIRAVLNQYIGDCKILGMEPLRQFVKEELIFSLNQIRACQVEGKKSLVDAQIRTVLLQSLSNAHRELLPSLQSILAVEI